MSIPYRTLLLRLFGAFRPSFLCLFNSAPVILIFVCVDKTRHKLLRHVKTDSDLILTSCDSKERACALHHFLCNENNLMLCDPVIEAYINGKNWSIIYSFMIICSQRNLKRK
jgi:hypothetical protein